MFKATIGIPFFNNEESLEYAIQSVINQEYKEWRLILINDGSTDRSIHIANKFKSDRITIIDDGENKGLIYRLNQLISITNTKYFVRMDADDIMIPNRLIKQVAMLERYSDIDAVGSSAYIIDTSNEVIGKRIVSFKGNSVDEVLKSGLFIHPTVVGKTSWFSYHKYAYGFNRAEDLELWCRAFNDSKFIQIKTPLLFYRDPLKMDISKYRASSKTVRKILRLYASSKIVKNKLLLREVLKVTTYSILNLINATVVANKRRNTALSKNEKRKALETLQNSIQGL